MQEYSLPSQIQDASEHSGDYISRLDGELRATLDKPDAADPYHYACSEALVDLLAMPPVKEFITSRLDKRKVIKNGENLRAWALERTVTTGFHMIAWETLEQEGSTHYPDEYMKPDPWHKIGKAILGLSHEPAHPRFEDVLHWLDLNTTKEGRRKVMELVLVAYSDRWERPNILDIGCSRGDLMLMTATNEPHSPFEITDSVDTTQLSTIANQALAKPVPHLGIKHGVDIHPFPDEFIYGQWYDSCVLRFGKVNDPKLVDLYKKMGSMDLRREYGIDQMSDDFSSPKLNPMTKRGHKTGYAEKYDIIQYSFMLYQLNEERRLQAILNGIKLLSPNGIILINDVVEPSKSNISLPVFPDIGSGSFRSLVYDNLQPTHGFQQLFTMENGEFNRGVIGKSQFSQDMWERLTDQHTS